MPPSFLTQISHLARFISMSLSSSASSLFSSSEVFSGAKAKTPDANLGRVQDGSPDKILRSNLTCTYPIHLSHSGSGWPISYSTHFPATPGLPPLIQRIQSLAPLSFAWFHLRLQSFIQCSAFFVVVKSLYQYQYFLKFADISTININIRDSINKSGEKSSKHAENR